MSSPGSEDEPKAENPPNPPPGSYGSGPYGTGPYGGAGTAEVRATGQPATARITQPVDLGPLGGFLARNPDVVDRMLADLDDATIDALSELVGPLAERVRLTDSEEEQWRQISLAFEEDEFASVVEPALDGLELGVANLESLLSQAAESPGEVTPADVPQNRLRKLAAVVVILVAQATGLIGASTNNVMLITVSSLISGMPGLYLWYKSL
jgi:hypothetical protein